MRSHQLPGRLLSIVPRRRQPLFAVCEMSDPFSAASPGYQHQESALAGLAHGLGPIVTVLCCPPSLKSGDSPLPQALSHPFS